MSGDADIIRAITLSDTKLLANLIETTNLVNEGKLGDQTPLMVAIRTLYGDLSQGTKVFDMILPHVEHVDARPYNETALHKAMRKPTDWKSDVNNIRHHIVKALLEKGANPHYPNDAGYSPFMLAVHERGQILYTYLSYWKDEYSVALIPTLHDKLLTDFVTNLKLCEEGAVCIDTAIAMRIGCTEFIDMTVGNSKDIMLKWLTANFSFPYPVPCLAISVFINRLNVLLAGSDVKLLDEEKYTFPAEKYNGYQIRVVVRCPSGRVVGCVFAPHVRFMQFVEINRKLE